MVNNLDHLSLILNMIDFIHNLDTECFNGRLDHPLQYFIIPSINVNPAAGLVLYLNMLHIL